MAISRTIRCIYRNAEGVHHARDFNEEFNVGNRLWEVVSVVKLTESDFAADGYGRIRLSQDAEECPLEDFPHHEQYETDDIEWTIVGIASIGE